MTQGEAGSRAPSCPPRPRGRADGFPVVLGRAAALALLSCPLPLARRAGVAVGSSSPLSPEEPPPVFLADHPFLVLVQDLQTSAILFLGRVTNPAPFS